MSIKMQKGIVYYSVDIIDNINININDVTREKDIIVPNVSNVDSKIQTGFFKKFTQKYPILQESLNIQQNKLGQNYFIKIKRQGNNNLYFFNMFADKSNKSRNINYVHLINCMLDIRNFCLNIKKQEDKNVEIHALKFGTGISGGRWSTIADLIEDCWCGIPTYIYKEN